MSDTPAVCERFREELTDWIDGEPSPAALDHLAGCDDCRDLRHDLREVARRLPDAGADYVAPDADELSARVLAALDARAGAAASATATAAPSSAAAPAAPASAAPAPAPAVQRGTPPWGTPIAKPLADGTEAPAEGPAAEVAAPASAPAAAPAPAPAVARTEAMPASKAPVATVTPIDSAARSAPRGARSGQPRWFYPSVAATVIAGAAAVVVALRNPHSRTDGPRDNPVLASTRAWQGRVVRVIRASSDAQGGLEVQLPGASGWSNAAAQASLSAGTRLRTDPRTRARVELDDGTVLVLDRATELSLEAASPRRARLASGQLVADVAHHDGAPNARIDAPTGGIEVIGTRFAMSATSDRSTVRVTRGVVRLAHDGRDVEVRAGEEGVAARGQELLVSPAVDLSRAVSWSELGPSDADPRSNEAPVGIGELRARRPGSTTERDQAVRLTSHSVKVRIVGNVARTEIEEVFHNDTGEQMEGIYRFPLPPDAQIEDLALDIDGRMEPGAFVDRNRASAIWRGVIRHATPTPPPRMPLEEYVWVPGPWRDPALLEWQRGGRTELRVFPIPGRGERKVRIAYTQTIPPSAEGRRYVYHLAHDPSGSTRVERFDVDLQVLGHDRARGVHPLGYELVRDGDPSSGASRFRYSRQGFVPAGDLVVEYDLPERRSPMTAWAYRPRAVPTTVPTQRTTATPPTTIPTAPGAPVDDRPFATMALRPVLPRWHDARPRDYVVVVDASRSMVGERLTRATRLASALVSEMDRRDRVTVLACDVHCRAMPGGMQYPSADTARGALRFLEGIAPAGGSLLGGVLNEAVRAAGESSDRALRVVYLGDGVPTVGHRRPEALARELSLSFARSGRNDTSLTTVAVGNDGDGTVLDALARAGGGVMVPYVPGQRLGAAALSVLEATWGVLLRDPTVELPEGMAEVAPARLSNVRAGSELIVGARMLRERVSGDVVLRGTVNGERFEGRYPLTLAVTEDEGNAFVPRLYAAARVADLEADGSDASRTEAVGLSQRFRVPSRWTSLLVLESEAMYSAYGINRSHNAPSWTGEQNTVATASPLGHLAGAGVGGGGLGTADIGAAGESAGTDRAEDTVDDELERDARAHADSPARRDMARESAAEERSEAGFGRRARARSNGIFNEQGAGDMATTVTRAPTPRPAPTAPAMEAPAQPTAPMAAAAPMTIPPVNAPMARNAGGVVAGAMPMQQQIALDSRPRGPGEWMRRVWVRNATVNAASLAVDGDLVRRVDEARDRLTQNPDSRDRHKALVRALSRAGMLDEARDVAERWSTRDPLDPEALAAQADVAARRGDRSASLRLLEGMIDARPEDAAAHERLAVLYERMGDAAVGCAHRVTLAEIRSTDAASVAAAVRCERQRGRDALATLVLGAARDPQVRARAESLAATSPSTSSLARGELTVSASWRGGDDLDLVLVDPQGQRISWQGGRAGITAEDASSRVREALGLGRLSTGEWTVELVRTGASETGDDDDNVDDPRVNVRDATGEVTVVALGQRRVLNFSMGQRSRAAVARVVVTREAMLVPDRGPVMPESQWRRQRGF